MKGNNKKKLFISQVMSGKTKAQIMAMRKRVEDFAEENDYEIAGNIRESYIDGIWNKDDESEWLSEIQIPVKKKCS